MRDGWTETKLGEYIDIKTGKLDVNAASEFGNYPFFTCSRETYRINEAAFEGESVLVAGNGDLSVKYYNGKFNAYQRTYVLNSVDKTVLDNRFLYIYMQTYIDFLRSETRGTVIQYLKKGQFTDAKIKLPPLPEQKRIVDLISSVDAYIESLEKQSENAKKTRSAKSEEIFSIADESWSEVSLGDVLDISRGGSPRPIQSYLTEDPEGINWVKISDATKSDKYIYNTSQKIKREGIVRSRQVFSGDFILSNSMSFGRPYIMRTNGCIHDGWLLFSGVSNNFDEDFLYNLLNSDYVQRQFASSAAGSGVRNLNIEVVKKVKVKIPSKNTQQSLVSILNVFDEFVIKNDNQIYKTRQLRDVLLSDLLTGNHEIPASYDKVMSVAS